ncbi:MAG: CinA family protein [Rickettsiales bacterium]|nr:MAG: CinA family protein [Rickettsiales bacterium]
MLKNELIALVQKIKDNYTGNITTAESCTGGMLAAYLTSISGSSAYFAGGIISYSNEAKIKLLNVKSETLAIYGAVSEQVAIEMALGAKEINNSDIAISVTGIAGPRGGTDDKPVGMVCFGLFFNDQVTAYTHYFKGNREQVRMQSCKMALNLIVKAIIA